MAADKTDPWTLRDCARSGGRAIQSRRWWGKVAVLFALGFAVLLHMGTVPLAFLAASALFHEDPRDRHIEAAASLLSDLGPPFRRMDAGDRQCAGKLLLASARLSPSPGNWCAHLSRLGGRAFESSTMGDVFGQWDAIPDDHPLPWIQDTCDRGALRRNVLPALIQAGLVKGDIGLPGDPGLSKNGSGFAMTSAGHGLLRTYDRHGGDSHAWTKALLAHHVSLSKAQGGAGRMPAGGGASLADGVRL